MHKNQNITRTTRKQQSVIKIFLWGFVFLILLIIVKQIAYPNSAYLDKVRPQNQAGSIQQHTDMLNTEAKELDATLDELRFDEDIRALRNE